MEYTEYQQPTNLIKPSKRLTKSYFGGLPTVSSKDFVWPRNITELPLSFLGQFDLSEVINPFPLHEGTLLFFFNPLESDSGDVHVHYESKKVKFRVKQPEDLNNDYCFRKVSVEFNKSYSYPDFDYFDSMNRSIGDALYEEAYNDFIFKYNSKLKSTLGGFANTIQFGLYTDVFNFYQKNHNLKKNDVTLLAQINYDDFKNDSMIFEGGKLFFFIPEKDLLEANFTNVLLIFQTD